MEWLISGAFGVWTLIDARSRKMKGFWWGLGVFLLLIIVFPYYLAVRNLKEGEIREGGKGWNVLKNFALLWTLFMAVVGIGAMVNMGAGAPIAGNEYEQAGYVLGAALGIGMLATLWFVVMVGALVLGLFLKEASVVEKGPTGPLKSEEWEPELAGQVSAKQITKEF